MENEATLWKAIFNNMTDENILYTVRVSSEEERESMLRNVDECNRERVRWAIRMAEHIERNGIEHVSCVNLSALRDAVAHDAEQE